MSEKIDSDYLTIKVDQEKIAKLENFSQQKELEIEKLINLFIDACTTGNLQLINSLFSVNNQFLTKSEIELIITESLKPLLDRLAILEANNNIINDSHQEETEEILINSVENEQQKSENINTESEIAEEYRKYLPRHEVWQMLKQTDYVKTCGYDAFLSAAPDQFIEYGIFFDIEKKRYYVKKI